MTSRAPPPFRVKICGVTRSEDALAAVAAGADAIGLNFVDGSPRRLSVGDAAAVAAAIPRGVLRVGVFVAADPAAIRATVASVGLDAVQLHGHWPAEDRSTADPPATCAALAGIPVIRATRLLVAEGRAALDPTRRWIDEATALGHGPAMVLVDATADRGAAAAGLGGSGKTVDWDLLRRAGALGVPIGLAGGLNAGNVAAAIAASGAVAVDTASGVESGPGRKDHQSVRRFVSAALQCLAERS